MQESFKDPSEILTKSQHLLLFLSWSTAHQNAPVPQRPHHIHRKHFMHDFVHAGNNHAEFEFDQIKN